MSTILKKFHFRRFWGRYPWEEWDDGQIRKLVRGEDFDVSVAGMRSCLYAHASRNGLKLHASKVDENTIVIQFLKREAMENE